MKNLTTEQILALVKLTLIEQEAIHYHPTVELYNKCHDEGGKFCSGPGAGVSGKTVLRDTDGVPPKIAEVPQKRGKLGGSLVDPHEGTDEFDGIRGYDKKGKPVPGTDAYLEAHNISRDIFERRPYVKYEASKEDPALLTAYPKDKYDGKGHRLFVSTAEDTDPPQTGGYIMYKNPAPGSPHGEVAPQVRPNAPVVTDKGRRAKALETLNNSKERLEVLEKTSTETFTRERQLQLKQAKINLARAEKLTPEGVREESNKRYEEAKQTFADIKASTKDPEIIHEARKELNREKRDNEKMKTATGRESFKAAEIESKTLRLQTAENRLADVIKDPQAALDKEIKRTRGVIVREENAYAKTAAKYLFTPGESSARIDVNQDPKNIKNLTQGKGRIYLAMEGSIKNDAILTSIRKEDPTAAVVNVPSVTLWQQKEPAEGIPSEIGWFTKKYAKGRDVILIPDADGVKNHAVMSQAKALKSHLLQNGAGQVYLATPPLKAGTTQIVDSFELPSGKREERKGIDDHLGAGRGTLGQLRYKTFTEYPDYDLTRYTKAGGATGQEKMSAGAKSNAEKVLASISGLVEDKGIATIPAKTMSQAAGFRQSQKTSALDARKTLERLGIIKVEFVYDAKALSRREVIFNPEMSEDRRDELVKMKVIKEPHIYKTYSDSSRDESPVVTILKPEYIIKSDKVHVGALSELPNWNPPKSFKGWTSAVDGRPDTTGIAKKQEENHQKFLASNEAKRRAATTPGKTTEQRLAQKKASAGSIVIRTEAGAKKYGKPIGSVVKFDAGIISLVVMTEEELAEFYNQCHDDQGRFCEGDDGPGRAVSGKFGGYQVTKIADAGRFGSVEVDGIKAKAVYEVISKNGDEIKLYDKTGEVGEYKDELLGVQARLHDLYPLQPPRDIVVTSPKGMGEVPEDTFSIVYGNKPVTYINSEMLGIDVGGGR